VVPAQEGDDFNLAITRRVHQRGLAVLIPGVNVGAGRQLALERTDVAATHSISPVDGHSFTRAILVIVPVPRTYRCRSLIRQVR
jgi:hypothetical protein